MLHCQLRLRLIETLESVWPTCVQHVLRTSECVAIRVFLSQSSFLLVCFQFCYSTKVLWKFRSWKMILRWINWYDLGDVPVPIQLSAAWHPLPFYWGLWWVCSCSYMKSQCDVLVWTHRWLSSANQLLFNILLKILFSLIHTLIYG